MLAQVQAVEESNSEEESLKQLINDSREQLRFAQDVFDHVKEGINQVTNEIVSKKTSFFALFSKTWP